MLFSIHKADGKVLLFEFWCTVEKCLVLKITVSIEFNFLLGCLCHFKEICFIKEKTNEHPLLISKRFCIH